MSKVTSNLSIQQYHRSRRWSCFRPLPIHHQANMSKSPASKEWDAKAHDWCTHQGRLIRPRKVTIRPRKASISHRRKVIYEMLQRACLVCTQNLSHRLNRNRSIWWWRRDLNCQIKVANMLLWWLIMLQRLTISRILINCHQVWVAKICI